MTDIQLFFNQKPAVLPLYEAIERMICAEFDTVSIRVQKTQISFFNKHLFACVSLPLRRQKGWPDVCLVFTLGLNRKLEHLRIAYAVEPYPGRWTHHILIQTTEEVDAELLAWIKEAYVFALMK